MRYAFIEEHRSCWAVNLMAEVLAVSVRGFYSWLGRPKSKRAKADETLTKQIVVFHCGSRCTYGSPRIHRELKAAGHNVGRKRVARLDLFSRKVVGWAFSDRLTDELTLAALEMATQQRPTPAKLLHHSVQGIQYASAAFRAAW